MTKDNTGAIIIEGHIQGLSNVRSLGEIGIPVFVVDKTNCIARYSKFCSKFFRCPDFIKDEFADFLIDLAIKENISGWLLLPSNDHAVHTIARNEQQLRNYFKITTPPIETLAQIYDKSKLLALAKECLIPVPETFYINGKNKDWSQLLYPALTKGKHGLTFYKTFSKKAFLSQNEKELKTNLKFISDKFPVSETFTQELIPYNNTISFTAFCEKGEIKTYWMGEKLREHPRRFGTATFARSVNIPECFDHSVPLMKALNYTGVCEIEYLFDIRTGKYKLIEMNARTWLWVGLAKVCGVDYARILYSFVSNERLDYPVGYKCDIYWVNPVTDMVYSILGILKGELKLSEYMASLKHKILINALFTKGDYTPGFFYLLNLFRIFKNR